MWTLLDAISVTCQDLTGREGRSSHHVAEKRTVKGHRATNQLMRGWNKRHVVRHISLVSSQQFGPKKYVITDTNFNKMSITSPQPWQNFINSAVTEQLLRLGHELL
jgi:hypothetical protein